MELRGFGLTWMLITLCSLGAPAAGQTTAAEKLPGEERENYYRKWLQQDVYYIIQDEEKTVFENLTTPEEREIFIEQFWRRRDPDPRTALNEFKEEHYRRIAYANEHFRSGQAGWKSDRGRIYIIHGPPEEIDASPSGGAYQRQPHEGGGVTATYPWERWRYRYIEGLGSDIEVEFVDPTFTGEFRLALSPDEKDALLHVPGGATFAELIGAAEKKDRPAFTPANRWSYPYYSEYQRAKDNPFARYETYGKVQAPEPIKYQDLRELVNVKVSYTTLPFEVREHFFRLNPQQALVSLTVEILNQHLTFKREGERQVARAAVYGIVSTITNQLVTEFEDDFSLSYEPAQLERGLEKRALYQKILVLEGDRRYKLDLVVKDLQGSNVGVLRKGLIPPLHEPEKLAASSLIIAEFIQFLNRVPQKDEMFVLGDVKVRPSINRRFAADRPLGIYFQIYNAVLDQTRLAPALMVSYRILRSGQTVKEILDESGNSIQFLSTDRVVFINKLSLQDLEPGSYRLQVEVEDQIRRQKVHLDEEFWVTGSAEPVALRR